MFISYLQKILWTIGLVLLQVLVLNHVHIAGYATPFLYIYLFVKFKSDTKRNTLLIWAFIVGILVDIFSDTPGMNAAATVMLAMFLSFLLKLFTPRDIVESFIPSARTMSFSSFFKFVALCVLLHHTVLLSLEYFSFVNLLSLLIKIVTSSILTLGCILAIEGIRRR